MKLSLPRKVQESKRNQKKGKNTEKIDWLLHQPIKSLHYTKTDILYKQIDKLFNEKIESVKPALDHGIRNEGLAIEKYQFIMNHKLSRPVKIREAGIIIQSQLFWLRTSPDGVIFYKKI